MPRWDFRGARPRIALSTDGSSISGSSVSRSPASDGHRWCTDLVGTGYVPAIACLGVEADGQVLNVNADTLAAALAAACRASRLVIAGGTAGVLDASGRTIDVARRGRASTRLSRTARRLRAWWRSFAPAATRSTPGSRRYRLSTGATRAGSPTRGARGCGGAWPLGNRGPSSDSHGSREHTR